MLFFCDNPLFNLSQCPIVILLHTNKGMSVITTPFHYYEEVKVVDPGFWLSGEEYGNVRLDLREEEKQQ